MKELSIEEKANRYDEVIKKANKMHHENCEACQMCIEELFSELAESKDERIRKALISILKSDFEKDTTIYDISVGDIIAWLEKQDKQKLPIEKLPEEMKTIGESLGFTTQEECDEYNQMVSELIMSDNDKGEQKPAWSEEDEDYYDAIITKLEVTQEDAALTDNQMNFLKSLKDRVQLQPKQEWNRENTYDLTDFENVMMHIGSSFFGQHAGLDPNDTNAIKQQANILLELASKREWSKEDETNRDLLYNALNQVYDMEHNKDLSTWINKRILLCSQQQWKPSDEQIKVLEFFIPYVTKCSVVLQKSKDTLLSLLSDLKKLREE